MSRNGHPGRTTSGRKSLGLHVARALVRIRAEIAFIVLDCLMVAVAYTTLLLLRFDLDVPTSFWSRFAIFLPVAVAAHVTSNWLWGCYGHVWRYASIEEARRLALAGATAGGVLFLGFAFLPDRLPLTVLVVGPVLATILMGATRFQSRLFAFQRAREQETGLRVLVVGAGSAGAAAIREMQRNSQSGMRPVAVVDDNSARHGRRLSGVPVVGSIDQLPRITRDYDVNQVLLAIPSGGPSVARRVAEAMVGTDLPVRVLPTATEWVQGRPALRDVRDLRIDDLLGRQQVQTDLVAVRDLLRARRVLVTGAGGSIGAELTRQIASCDPEILVLVDHDETHLHDATADLDVPIEARLVDIRDRLVLDALFEELRPEIVFHAAAHKHVPILETHPSAAARTNVLGTASVVDVAVRYDATHLVHISSDKAAQPTSVMGATKWLAEQIVLARAPAGRRFCSVRFGNVLGSRGSVIPTFQRQIAAGGPVTVTDPRMTRYFMSPGEAVSLVLQAAVVAGVDDVLMLEMGERVNILELAERMIQLCGREVGTDIEIKVTGARPGENLSEDVHGPNESTEATGSPSIMRVRPVTVDPGALDDLLGKLVGLVARGDDDAVRRLLLAQPLLARSGPVRSRRAAASASRRT